MSASHDYDVIVIGTGLGGASAAESLAVSGLKVGILERGTWWGAFGGHRPTPETLPQLAAALTRLNMSTFGRGLSIPISGRGMLELSFHGGTIVVNCSAVGGNSAFSGALLQRPAPQFFDALPPELTGAELAPHYERIERALQVSAGPRDQRKVGVLTALAEKEHWRVQSTPRAIRWESDDAAARPPCTNCNLCAFSCNVGAKLGMDQTLIPSAIKAGAVLRGLCEVQTVEPVPGGYEVRFHDQREGRSAAVRAPRVVVSAGTMNTLKILLRSAANGLGKIPGLGQHFSMGGDTLAFYRVPRDVAPEKIEGHFLDAQMLVPGAENKFDHHTLCLPAPFIGGSRLLRLLQGRRTLPLFGFGPDAMDGEVNWNGRGIVVRHKPQAVVARIQSTHDRIAQEFGRKKSPRPVNSERRARPWISCHPIGGCRMATDAGRGVVNFRGEVFGHPGLYVADASIFPTMTIGGPQLSVSALASWIAERIVKDAA